MGRPSTPPASLICLTVNFTPLYSAVPQTDWSPDSDPNHPSLIGSTLAGASVAAFSAVACAGAQEAMERITNPDNITETNFFILNLRKFSYIR